MRTVLIRQQAVDLAIGISCAQCHYNIPFSNLKVFDYVNKITCYFALE